MKRFTAVKYLLWIYFFLLIFEGALRKWILPGLSTPLLVIRDPVALAAVCIGWPYLVNKKWFWAFATLAFLAMVPAYFVGHGNIMVALYGARIWLVHVPLIFLFAAVCTRDDVWLFAKAFLWIAIPMALLVAAQYSLPQGHFLNRAPGGEGGVGMSGALGKYRPPGTFSFINALSDYFGLCAAFLMGWFISGPRPLPKWLFLSADAILLALAVSISRTLLYYYALVFLAGLASGGASPRMASRMIGSVVAIAVAAFLLSLSPLYRDGMTTFGARWDTAAGHGGYEEREVRSTSTFIGGAVNRITGGLASGLTAIERQPIFGYGIGAGTNVGAMLMRGQRFFMIAEDSWPAMVGELGPILGATLILLRLAFAIWLATLCVRHAMNGNALPLILGAISCYWIVYANTAQATGLGFIVIGAGLTLAACNPTRKEIVHQQRRKLAINQLISQQSSPLETNSQITENKQASEQK